jgi:fructokinase
MQIGIDLGASKIESVVLDEQGNEKHRQRVDCPKNYNSIIEEIKKIVSEIESKIDKTLPLGVCHPGVHSPQSGLVKNAPNCIWIEKKPFQKDLREALGREVFCENDANCFALSEAIDGAGKHYKIVYGIILGSGAGGGLVIDKQIVNGPNGIAGEWGHNQLPYMAAKKENLNTTSLRESEIESFISGMGLAKKYNKKYKQNLKAKEIFELYRKHDIEADKFIDEFKINLAMSLSTIINILDPDAFVFGGGVSNSIDFFPEIQTLVKKYIIGREYDGVFLKPKFGDASGVRGAARLGRKTTY